jgi:hypothetical protein
MVRQELKWVIALSAVVAAALAVGLASQAHAASGSRMQTMGSANPMSGMSLHERYAYLARQHSNTCMINPASFATMNPTSRLQGACCGPMDEKMYPEYVEQIHSLARYDHSIVPSDPYNMSVGLARRLVGFNDRILLTPAQQKIYDNAFPLAADHAPCCCDCWRWTAFEGQAKYLIVYRRFTSKQIAELWTLEDGCGDTSGPGAMQGMGG